MNRYCVLDETKVCDGCGECDRCDLDPGKICDNCMKCVQGEAEYLGVEIEGIQMETEFMQKQLRQGEKHSH